MAEKTPKFSTMEKFLLVELVGQHRKLILARNSDHHIRREKSLLWADIASEINCQLNLNRDSSAVRRLWDYLACRARRAVFCRRKNYGPSAGNFFVNLSPILRRVADLLYENDDETLNFLKNEDDGRKRMRGRSASTSGEAPPPPAVEEVEIETDDDDETPEPVSIYRQNVDLIREIQNQKRRVESQRCDVEKLKRQIQIVHQKLYKSRSAFRTLEILKLNFRAGNLQVVARKKKTPAASLLLAKTPPKKREDFYPTVEDEDERENEDEL